MRTVTGPTDRVVVIGAGLAGLSAALRLAGAGRAVTVLEREAVPGGRAGLLAEGGYRFDTGPSVLTMPDLIADALDCVGEELSDWLTLTPLDPAYRAYFPDGSTLNVHSDVAAMEAEIAAVCGGAEAAGYRRFVAFVGELFRVEFASFIDRNVDSPLDLLRPALGRLALLGAFRRLAPKVAQYFEDPRTRRVFSFQAMYAGLSPFEALALYAVIAHMDSVAGVYFPVGGMHELPRALAAAAEKHGVTFFYDTEVTTLEVTSGRAVAALCADGTRVPGDVFVVNPDLPVAYRELLGGRVTPRRVAKVRHSPSCFLLLAGSTATYSQTAHHNLHFGAAWRSVFADVIDNGRLMTDPSLLVTHATRTDPSLAPPGRETYAVLAPVPNLSAGLDWSRLRKAYRDELVARVERLGYVEFGDGIEVEAVTTPRDWAAQGLAEGTPFSAAHRWRQTGPFRAGNVAPRVDGVVFAGAGTQPGVGVPMVLISGRLAAERITGPDRAYRSRVVTG